MYLRPTLVLAAALALCADVPDTTRFRNPLPGVPNASSLPSPMSLPDVFVSVVQQSSKKPSALRPQSRLSIIRYVSGEFAKVVKPIPGGRKGFKVTPGKKFEEKDLNQALKSQGAAANPGDTVQITNIDFRPKEIVIEVNGGGKKRFHLGEHLQIGMGNATSAPAQSDPREGRGATLILDYSHGVPDMSADDLMHDLGVFLDFSKEHSATVNWIDTLPPQFKQAIQDRQAVVGMDHEMVLAALGRPEHKVRERNPEGDETEDWIYGTPPSRTTFVTFAGDKVIRVKQYN
ncbi:MAG: hypothetical protein WBP79_05370 [Candidatus Acidiferrales bacterium]